MLTDELLDAVLDFERKNGRFAKKVEVRTAREELQAGRILREHSILPLSAVIRVPTLPVDWRIA